MAGSGAPAVNQSLVIGGIRPLEFVPRNHIVVDAPELSAIRLLGAILARRHPRVYRDVRGLILRSCIETAHITEFLDGRIGKAVPGYGVRLRYISEFGAPPVDAAARVKVAYAAGNDTLMTKHALITFECVTVDCATAKHVVYLNNIYGITLDGRFYFSIIWNDDGSGDNDHIIITKPTSIQDTIQFID